MPTKTCIITGASRGIGLATARRFASAGYHLVLSARGEQELKQAAAKVATPGIEAVTVVGDIAQPETAQRLVDTAVGRFGRVDVLINNAGFGVLKPIEETTSEDFDRTLAVNVAGVFHMTRAVWPVMRQQGGGIIVNISSVASVDPFRGFSVYGASKAWVSTFSQATADEGAGIGIRVYCVAPGAVETSMLRSLIPNVPDKYVLEPEAVAATIEAICGDRMAYCTGQAIFVRKR